MAQLRLTEATLNFPDGSINNGMIANPTGSQPAIDANKVNHKYKEGSNFGQAIGGAPVAREEIVFTAHASGAISRVSGLLNVTGSTGSVTYDCKVNGVTRLSSPITVQSTNADREVVDGTISNAAVTAGDVISIELAVTGSDGTGPFAWVEIIEAP